MGLVRERSRAEFETSICFRRLFVDVNCQNWNYDN